MIQAITRLGVHQLHGTTLRVFNRTVDMSTGQTYSKVLQGLTKEDVDRWRAYLLRWGGV